MLRLIGTLAFDYKVNQMTDGVNWYDILSPSLLFRLIQRKKTRPLINGVAYILGTKIIWFNKIKYTYHHVPIKENINVSEIVNKRKKLIKGLY
jgi:hypothetical protein